MRDYDKRVSNALIENLSSIKASDELIQRTLNRVNSINDTNLDDEISSTLNSELLKITASDDLIAKTLARVNADEHVVYNEAKLSALNMGYIKGHEDRKKQRVARKERIILATLAAAASILIISNVALHLGNTGSKSSSAAETLSINNDLVEVVIAEEHSVSVREVQVVRPRVQRRYITGAYNANVNNIPTPGLRNRAF